MLNIDQILSIKSDAEFEAAALELFRFQADRCKPYKEYISLLGIDPEAVSSVEDIPFLPIELFKTHDIYSFDHEPERIFTSSNTGQTVASRHLMASLDVYRKAFTAAFEQFYGTVQV